mgnify:CR=1 FL=1
MIYKIKVNTGKDNKINYYNLEFNSILQALEVCKNWFWRKDDKTSVIISSTGSSTAIIYPDGNTYIREESEGKTVNV